MARLPHSTSVVTAAVLAVAVLCYFLVDEPLIRAYARWPEGVRDVFEVITDLGISTWYLIVSFTVYLLCRFGFKRQIRLRAAALLVFASVATSGILVNAIKFVLGRARPIELFDHGRFGFTFFETTYARVSFPSGHATTAAALAVSLALIHPPTRWLWFSLGLVVAWSRVITLHHYPSDVIVGFYFTALLTLWLYRVLIVRRGQSVQVFSAYRAPAPARSRRDGR